MPMGEIPWAQTISNWAEMDNMRFESIELIGYIGIFNGMGLHQIKIDFSRCKTNKIIIRGSNGSGKSTLMGAMHLYPDQNDSFMPSREARKTIVVRDNEKIYVIKYIHPVQNNGQRTTAKGFIARSINGSEFIELNPGGMVSVCKDIISEEFEFDPSYVALAQLSSEDRGLVDRRPVERKKLINSIISSLDIYNGIYKTISKRSGVLKNLITSIGAKIDLIGNDAKILASISNLTKQIEILEQDKAKTIEAIAAVKLKLAELQGILQQAQYDQLSQEIKTLNTSVKDSEIAIQKVLNGFDLESLEKLEAFNSHLSVEIVSLESKIDILNQQIPSMLSDREKESDRLQDKQQQLEGLKSGLNIKNVVQILEESKKKIAEYDKVFKRMGLLNISLITRDEFNAAMRSLNRLQTMANNIMHNYDLGYIRKDVYDRSVILELISSYPSKKKELDQSIIELSQIDKKIAIYLTKRELARELINRPKKCKIDECVYIAEALKADREYPEQGLSDLENSARILKEKITSLEKDISEIEIFSMIRSDISQIESELENGISFITKLPVRPDFKETFLTRMVELDNFNDVTELYQFVDCGNMLDEYRLLTENIKTYEAENEIYLSKAKIIESILTDIEVLDKKISQVTASIDQINQDIYIKRSKLEEIKSYKTKTDAILTMVREVYIPNKNRLESLLDKKKQFEGYLTEVESYQEKLSILSNNLGSTDNDIKNLLEQREAFNHSLLMLNEYKIELDQYQKENILIEKLRYYSSPSTGIQVMYINMYMNKLLTMANQLLGLLFQGRFMLQNFVINDSEFRIPCLGESGIMHDDISSMSSAEKAMISMILSFSLMHQSSMKYNILCLDEMDAALDDMNRFAFIELLDNIMHILRVEQCFLISHNSEIDTSMCDMILLRNDSNEKYNCNIIWKY